MRPGRVVALVMGCLLLLPGVGMLIGGGGLGLAYAFARDDGYFEVTLDRVETETAAVTAEDLTFQAEPGSPDWLLDALDVDVRLRVTSADGERSIFVGIGPETDVDRYLAGVAHDEIVELDGLTPVYRDRSGQEAAAEPTTESFWLSSTSGRGTQELLWEARSGEWAVVVMNADGTSALRADVNVGVKADFVLPLAVILLGLGTVITAGAVALIVVGATGGRRDGEPPAAGEALVVVAPLESTVPSAGPVSLRARVDPEPSRWLWLVKWLLAIPHFIVLVFLWLAFIVTTAIAGLSIVFTGVYPRGLFDFNVGVLRWSWRVTYYATIGGIGTDRYPPFGLAGEPEYPATLDVTYPTRLSRGLVLVKWWLLAIPHYLIVALLLGGSLRWIVGDSGWFWFDPAGTGGILAFLVLVTGLILLFTGRYPSSLGDLVVGLNRWIYRVVAYAALMTDEYPPFRLDQGGDEPDGLGPGSPTGTSPHREPVTASQSIGKP
ncbi:MAG: DUF4389 domain-containing protein [Acidimicrobiia bacterium]|nr:DUF4389 domain-containing protein [Acidimicrobiia bacterium]